MELINTNDSISFDPTLKLKSSPIPITFISFYEDDDHCIDCRKKYDKTIFFEQRYCKKCLSKYILNDKVDNNRYFDVLLDTRSLNPLKILCFKQIPEFERSYLLDFDEPYRSLFEDMIVYEKHCSLCGKSYQRTDERIKYKIKLCSDCYIISSGSIKSNLIERTIKIIYLPWWCNDSVCRVCDLNLTFISDCQKYCKNCYTFFIGCRYCLTTSIIFGPTNQSQCIKCKRVTNIIFNININICDNIILDNFLLGSILDNIKGKKYFYPSLLYYSIYEKIRIPFKMKWIPYSQIKNAKKIAEGGFSTIYKATWLCYESHIPIVLKKLKNSKDSKDFLNELESNYRCFKNNHNIVKVYGFTKDPELDDYMLVMQYESGGDLHNLLQNKFLEIEWTTYNIYTYKDNKYNIIDILKQITYGLDTIHNSNIIHRDLHSGNILFDCSWKIGDLGLSRPANSTSSNDEIYGVIPYIAPEIFLGSGFSKKSDVYSMGMIMWELTTGCKPFFNDAHDLDLVFEIINGKRPEITEDTPDCFANLMRRCWNPNPIKRPSTAEIYKAFYRWDRYSSYFRLYGNKFTHSEVKRKDLIRSGKLIPKKSHPKSVYISRPLSFFISKCSSINSFSRVLDYTSIELELDIDIKSSSLSNLPNSKSKSVVQSSLRKRHIEESNIEEVRDNDCKYILRKVLEFIFILF